MDPAQTTRDYNQSDIRQHAIFTSPEGYRCEVVSLEGTTVHLRVLDNKKINNETEISMPFNKLKSENWSLQRKAA